MDENVPASREEDSRSSPVRMPFIDWFAAASFIGLCAWLFWPGASFVGVLRACYAGTAFEAWAPPIAAVAVGVYGIFAIGAVNSGHLVAKIRLLLSGAVVPFLALAVPLISTFLVGGLVRQ